MKVESQKTSDHPIARAFDKLLRGIFRKPDSRFTSELKPSDEFARGLHRTKTLTGEEVTANPTIVRSQPILTLTCIPHQADFRIVNGKNGRTIRALKYLADSAGQRDGIVCEFTLEESYLGENESSQEFRQNPEFDVAAAIVLVNELWALIAGPPLIGPGITFERKNDELIVRIPADADNPDATTAIKALDEVFYPYGFGQGMILKVRRA